AFSDRLFFSGTFSSLGCNFNGFRIQFGYLFRRRGQNGFWFRFLDGRLIVFDVIRNHLWLVDSRLAWTWHRRPLELRQSRPGENAQNPLAIPFQTQQPGTLRMPHRFKETVEAVSMFIKRRQSVLDELFDVS